MLIEKADILKELTQAIVELKIEKIGDLVSKALRSGIEPLRITRYVNKGMSIVGQRFQNGEYFLSDLIMAGETMKEALEVLRPHLKVEKAEGRDKIILGTIIGDLHDIGKEIAKTLLISAGFEIYDLGIDVMSKRFVEKAKEVDANIIGISALLTTSVVRTAEVVDELEKSGLRDKVKVIVGGAATREWMKDKFGVDAVVNDAVEGVRIIKSWSEKK